MTTPNAAPSVAVRGDVTEEMVAYALDKLDSVVSEITASVVRSEVHLDHHADPARRPRYYVEMVADVDGDVVRARQERGHGDRGDRRRRGTAPPPHEPGPGSSPFPALPAPRRDELAPRRRAHRPSAVLPAAGRRADDRAPSHVRHTPESIEEAVADLDALDHDFLLFVDDATNAEAIIYRVGDGFGIRQRVPTSLERLGAPIDVRSRARDDDGRRGVPTPRRERRAVRVLRRRGNRRRDGRVPPLRRPRRARHGQVITRAATS